MGRTLYIIDGHSQIYRAYYAPFRDLTSPSGEPTRATYVFCAMLLKFIADKKPPYLAMAIDGPRSGEARAAIFPDYKAKRPPMPDDLPPQIDRILQIVRAMGIPVLEIPGFEADDIIATLAARHAGEDTDVVAISRDKDLDQIVGPHVTMYDPMKDQTFDAAAIESIKGYSPGQAVEVQSLMGDAIDNIPGIPGIGPKTAARLIQKYGTAQAVLAHADEQTPKLRQSLIEHAANVDLARKLVTLDRNVPLAVDLEAMRFAGVPAGALRPLFAELGFHRMFDQLDQIEKGPPAGAPAVAPAPKPGAAEAPPAEPRPGPAPWAMGKTSPAGRGSPGVKSRRKLHPGQGSLFTSAPPEQPATDDAPPPTPIDQAADVPAYTPPKAAFDPARAAAEAMTSAADFDYRCIDTPEALAELGRQLAGVTSLSVDTETTSSQPMWCKLVGVSLCWQAGHAVYIPIMGLPGDRVLPLEEVRKALGPVLADPDVEKVGQNLKYDLIVLKQAGFEFRGKLFCTMVAAHVLDSTRMTYGLGALAAEFLSHRCIPIEELIGRGRKQITMDQVPCAQVATYSSEDADVAFRLAGVFRQRLVAQGLMGLFEDLEMPLLPVLAEMERAGIIIDAEVLGRQEEQLQKQADALRSQIIAAALREFNPDSPKQLAEVLFGDLKLTPGRLTKTGPSTDSEVLEQLAVFHALPGLVLDYRKLTKLIGTYLSALVECIHPATGRVHTDFHQAGTATGRLSSSDPNLQNIPIRTEEGKRIRAAFVAAPGQVLLSADYSQVELRVLAHLCEDPTLIAAFAADQDIHRIVAAEVFGVALDAVTPEQRAKAKTVNFGIIYGQTAFGLSLSLRISRTEARDFIDRYKRRFPRIDEFLQSCIKFAKSNGYVETIFGRRRGIPEIAAANPQRRALAERLAINSVVQGSAADLIKQAMVNIAARIREERRPSRMLLQIHDELVFEIPSPAVDAEREMIVREMSSAIQLRVPVKVDTGVGKNWMEAK